MTPNISESTYLQALLFYQFQQMNSLVCSFQFTSIYAVRITLEPENFKFNLNDTSRVNRVALHVPYIW